MLSYVLPWLWVSIIGFCIIMYTILDGFTLGTGLLFPFIKDPSQKDIAMSVILPTWDGNQTWLVLGVASLYGGFPLAFSLLMPILYFPLLLMVICLLLRGVAFEFRLKAKGEHRKYWSWLFSIGCLGATLSQGLLLGSFIHGFNHIGEISIINPVPSIEWLTPFSTAAAIFLVFGYALLASTRLILKTHDPIKQNMFHISKICLILTTFGLIIVSLWTPWVDPYLYRFWFNPKFMPYLAILPVLSIFVIVMLWKTLKAQNDLWPYWLSVAIFILAYIGFVLGTWPFIIPHKITIWQAAAPLSTLKFLSIGGIIMVPFLCFYTFYSYYVFKGKVKEPLAY